MDPVVFKDRLSSFLINPFYIDSEWKPCRQFESAAYVKAIIEAISVLKDSGETLLREKKFRKELKLAIIKMNDTNSINPDNYLSLKLERLCCLILKKIPLEVLKKKSLVKYLNLLCKGRVFAIAEKSLKFLQKGFENEYIAQVSEPFDIQRIQSEVQDIKQRIDLIWPIYNGRYWPTTSLSPVFEKFYFVAKLVSSKRYFSPNCLNEILSIDYRKIKKLDPDKRYQQIVGLLQWIKDFSDLDTHNKLPCSHYTDFCNERTYWLNFLVEKHLRKVKDPAELTQAFGSFEEFVKFCPSNMIDLLLDENNGNVCISGLGQELFRLFSPSKSWDFYLYKLFNRALYLKEKPYFSKIEKFVGQQLFEEYPKCMIFLGIGLSAKSCLEKLMAQDQFSESHKWLLDKAMQRYKERCAELLTENENFKNSTAGNVILNHLLKAFKSSLGFRYMACYEELLLPFCHILEDNITVILEDKKFQKNMQKSQEIQVPNYLTPELLRRLRDAFPKVKWED